MGQTGNMTHAFTLNGQSLLARASGKARRRPRRACSDESCERDEKCDLRRAAWRDLRRA